MKNGVNAQEIKFLAHLLMNLEQEFYFRPTNIIENVDGRFRAIDCIYVKGKICKEPVLLKRFGVGFKIEIQGYYDGSGKEINEQDGFNFYKNIFPEVKKGIIYIEPDKLNLAGHYDIHKEI